MGRIARSRTADPPGYKLRMHESAATHHADAVFLRGYVGVTVVVGVSLASAGAAVMAVDRRDTRGATADQCEHDRANDQQHLQWRRRPSRNGRANRRRRRWNVDVRPLASIPVPLAWSAAWVRVPARRWCRRWSRFIHDQFVSFGGTTYTPAYSDLSRRRSEAYWNRAQLVERLTPTRWD